MGRANGGSRSSGVMGEATISLAGVDLIYVGLKVLVSSVETAQQMRSTRASDPALLDVRGS